MIRSISSATICALLVCGVMPAADVDPVEKQLTAAKEEFEKARNGLLAELKKKEQDAQKAGDLKTLEQVQAEAKALADNGELPKSVSTQTTQMYLRQMRVARARMEVAYEAAVKQYTKDGKVPLARAIRQELEEFKTDPPQKGPGDAAKEKSEWTGYVKQYLNGKKDADGDVRMVFVSRKGRDFVAEYWVHDGEKSLEFRGTIDNRGKVEVNKVVIGKGGWPKPFIDHLKITGELKKNTMDLQFKNGVTGHSGNISVKLND